MSDQKGGRLTDRDLEILNFINDFGFVEMPCLAQRFQLSQPRSYQITGRLKNMGLVTHEYVFYKRHGIFKLTKAGAALTDLPPLDRIPLTNYKHQLAIIEVYLQLLKMYPAAQWVSERRLLHKKFKSGVGKGGHIADGLLLHNGKKIAIEVELTPKGKERLEKIIDDYMTNFELHEVWYYCSNQVQRLLEPLIQHAPMIKIYVLDKIV